MSVISMTCQEMKESSSIRSESCCMKFASSDKKTLLTVVTVIPF